MIKRITIGVFIVVILALWLKNVRDGLVGASRAELKAMLLRWNEMKSQPEPNLKKLLQNSPSNLVFSNRVFEFEHTNHVSLFANTRVSTGGTLFVTSNGVFILVNSKGTARIME